jgi:hypothetical protein
LRRRALLGAAVLAGCGGTPRPSAAPAGAVASAAQNWANGPPVTPPAGGRLWRLDAEASQLRIVVFRGGAAARLGHHHIVQAARCEGWLWLPEQGLEGAQGRIDVPLAELQLDEPAWRQAAGGEFDERPLSAEDRSRHAAQPACACSRPTAHPKASLQLQALGGAAPWWLAEVGLSVGGGLASLRVALDVRQHGAALRTAGRLPLRHADLGLQPFSVLGGLLAVREELVLDFDLHWRR